MKAKYIGKVREGYAVHLEYEYRGKRYWVTDEHNGYSEPMWVKHKNEQERIDREIEEKAKPKIPARYEDTAEYGFTLFWDYVESEV